MASTTTVTTKSGSERLPETARKAVRGAWLGLFVDFFDIYLPIVALAPATAYFLSKDLPPALAATLTLIIFATSFLGRPIGSVLFGSLSERLGRRRVTLIAGTGTATATILTAFLPGYPVIGVAAPILLIVARLVGGIFMGGQYTGANPLAMEELPNDKRGLWGSVIAGAYPIAFVAISVVTFVLLQSMPLPAYIEFGWRIPFVIGGLLTFGFVLYFHRKVAESVVWESQASQAKKRRPLRELLTGPTRTTFLQVFLMMTGVWMGLQLLPGATPALLIGTIGVPAVSVTFGLLACNVVLAVAYPIIGILGQRFGRRRLLITAGVLTILVTAPLYALLIGAAQGGSLVVAFALLAVCLVLTLGPNAVNIAYLCERFPTNVRSIGYGMGYSLPVIIPSFYGVFMDGVGHLIPYQFSPVPLLVIGGVLTAIGAAIGPRTNQVDFHAHDDPRLVAEQAAAAS